MQAFDELVAVVRRLRADDGCPWDKAQTPTSLADRLLEETYEVIEDVEDGTATREELGDLLFVLTLIARIHEERGAFTIEDALTGVTRKLIDRHPHVFGDASDGGGIMGWEARKRAEKRRESALDGIPAALPALLRAERLGSRASSVGFDWPDRSGVRAKLDEEVAELDEAIARGDRDAIADELGDLLFTVVNLARFLQVPAESALRAASSKFERRFRAVEAATRADGIAIEGAAPELLDGYWRRAKETA